MSLATGTALVGDELVLAGPDWAEACYDPALLGGEVIDYPGAPVSVPALSPASSLAYFGRDLDTEPLLLPLGLTPETIQARAFETHREDFIYEVHRLAETTQPGVVYGVTDYWDDLPRILRWRAEGLAAVDPRGLKDVVFTWAWNGETPEVVIYRDDPKQGADLLVVKNEQDGNVYLVPGAQGLQVSQRRDPRFSSSELPTASFSPDAWVAGAEGGTPAYLWDEATQSFVVNHEPVLVGPDRPLLVQAAEPVAPQPVALNFVGGEREGREYLLEAAGIFMMGSLKPTPGAGPKGPQGNLPIGRMALGAGIGGGLLLGVHYSIVEGGLFFGEGQGIPMELAPLVDTGILFGGVAAVDYGSAGLARLGVTSGRVFPHGVGYGGMVQGMGFAMPLAYGSSAAFHAAGWEYGSTENFVGTVGTTVSGYVGVSTTTRLLAMSQNPVVLRLAANPALASEILSTQSARMLSWRFPELHALAGSDEALLRAAGYVEKNGRVIVYAGEHARLTQAALRLDAGYASATGRMPLSGAPAPWLQPAVVGGRTLSLPGALGAGGLGGGIYIAGGGPAGGAGFVGGGLQVVGVAGAVLLGVWVGEGIVHTTLWAMDLDDDPDAELVDVTWNHIHQQAGAYVLGDTVGPVFGTIFDWPMRGIESTPYVMCEYLIPDSQWMGLLSGPMAPTIIGGRMACDATHNGDVMGEGLEVQWNLWELQINLWGGQTRDMLMRLALYGAVGEGFDEDNPAAGPQSVRFYEDAFRGNVASIMGDETPNSEGYTKRMEGGSVYRMAALFRDSTQGRRLEAPLKDVMSVFTSDGQAKHLSDLPGFLRAQVREKQEAGHLRGEIRRMLMGARQEYATRLVDLGLAQQAEDDSLSPITPERLTTAQSIFLYGGDAGYAAVVDGSAKRPADMHPEAVIMQNRIRTLQYLYNRLEGHPTPAEFDAAAFLFPQ